MKRLFTFLVFSLFAYSSFATDYYWIGATGGTWSTASNWSLTSGGAAAASGPFSGLDKAFFTSSATVTVAASQVSLGSLTLSAGATVVLQTTATSTYIFGATLPAIVTVPVGATLQLNSAVTNATTGGVTLKTNAGSTIGGTLECVSGSGSKIDVGGNITITGTIKIGTQLKAGSYADCGNYTFTSGTVLFNANSVFELARSAGGSIPNATWDATSEIKITGCQSTGGPALSWGGFGQSIGKFTYDCPAQGSTCNLGMGSSSNPATVKGNFVINSTNNLTIRLGGSSALTCTFKGTFSTGSEARLDLLSSGTAVASLTFESDAIIAGPVGVNTNTATSHIFKFIRPFGGQPQTFVIAGAITQGTAGILSILIDNNGDGVKLAGANLGTLKNITCTSGKLFLNGFDLKLAGTMSGGATTGYVVTEGGSKVTIKGIGFEDGVAAFNGKGFQIGKSGTSYDPVFINTTVSGTTGDYTIGAKDRVTTVYIPASVSTTEWDISGTYLGGTTIEVGGSSFSTMVTPKMGHYLGTSWEELASVAGTGFSPIVSYKNTVPVTSFSPYVIGNALSFNPPPLAVELKKLTAYANGKINKVEWSTASEKNMKEYIVERSADGINAWAAFTTQAANNKDDSKYSVEDATASALSFYRVKSVELNGKEEMSKIVSVKRETKGKLNISKAYPNPTVEAVQVDFEVTSNSNVTVSMTDVLGRVVSNKQVQAVEGLNRLDVNLNAVAKGIYILTLQEGNNIVTQRIVKQ
jgi:Secretion system C-terminal sorting domain